MTSIVEPMDISLFQDDNGEDDIHSDIFRTDENSSCSPSLIMPDTRYENRGGTFTTGIDIFSKDEQQKMMDRAKRFGLKNVGNSSMIVQENDLYMSMGIDEDSENAKYCRLNALHMRGTENMSTKDVFDYFGTYAPASIEWINDVSCNVIWLDKISTARALLGLSKRIVGLGERKQCNLQRKSEENFDVKNNISNEDCTIDITNDDQQTNDDSEQNDNTVNINAIDFPLPSGVWRKGVDCPKSKTILLRFATSSDKKQQRSEKLSDYYKKYGNPNYGGMRGILTDSRKRMYKQTRINKKRPLNATSDIDDGKRTKNPWGALSETWGANDFVENDFVRRTRANDNRNEPVIERGGIKERLGSKFAFIDKSVNDESSDSDSQWNKRSKIIRMRMHADDEEEKVQKKRLKQLTKKIHEKMSGNDLRSRLGRPKPPVYHDTIQVVVTNTSESYRNSMRPVDDDGDDDDDDDNDDNDDDDNDNDNDVDEIEKVTEVFEMDKEEKEEGEWEEEDDTDNVKEMSIEVVTEQEQEHAINEHVEDEEEFDSDSSSDISEKEVQGPQGSVIKVIPRAKPRVASTVWARLNQDAQKRNIPNSERQDLRATLKGDLRSRLGYHNRQRSPLRIEVKNDKYAQDNSESE